MSILSPFESMTDVLSGQEHVAASLEEAAVASDQEGPQKLPTASSSGLAVCYSMIQMCSHAKPG